MMAHVAGWIIGTSHKMLHWRPLCVLSAYHIPLLPWHIQRLWSATSLQQSGLACP